MTMEGQMGFKQFITEAPAIDLFKQHYFPRIWKLVKDDPNIGRYVRMDMFESLGLEDGFAATLAFQFAVMDPTSNATHVGIYNPGDLMMGKYTRQIIEWAIKVLKVNDAIDQMFTALDAVDLRELLSTYDQNLEFLPPEYKSITSFTTLKEFHRFMSMEFHEVIQEVKTAKLMKSVKVWYDDEEWMVLTPLTYMASVHFGSPDWCTADPDSSNYFNRYRRQGTLVMFLDQNNRTESYQVLFPGKMNVEEGEEAVRGVFECKDWEDRPQDYQEVIPRNLIELMEENGFVDPSQYEPMVGMDYNEARQEILFEGYLVNRASEEVVDSVAAKFRIIPVTYKHMNVELVTALPDIYWLGQGMAFVKLKHYDYSGLDAFVEAFDKMLSDNGVDSSLHNTTRFADLLQENHWGSSSGAKLQFDWFIFDRMSFSNEDDIAPIIFNEVGVDYSSYGTTNHGRTTMYYLAGQGDLSDCLKDFEFRKWYDNNGGEVDFHQLEFRYTPVWDAMNEEE